MLRPTNRQVNAKGLLRLPRALYGGKFMLSRPQAAATGGELSQREGVGFEVDAQRRQLSFFGHRLAAAPWPTIWPMKFGGLTSDPRRLFEISRFFVSLSAGAIVVMATFLREPLAVPMGAVLFASTFLGFFLSFTFFSLALLRAAGLEEQKDEPEGNERWIKRVMILVTLGMGCFWLAVGAMCAISLRIILSWP